MEKNKVHVQTKLDRVKINNPSIDSSKLLNKPKRRVILSIIFLLLGIFIFFSPILFDIDVYSGGGALFLLGLLVFFTSLVLLIFFNMQSKDLLKTLNGSNIISSWTLSTKRWNDFIKKCYELEVEDNRIKFYIVVAFSLFFGILFLILDFESGIYVFFTMIGLIIIIWLVAYLTPILRMKRDLNHPKSIILFDKGLYYAGEWYTFNGFMMRLEDISYKKNKNLIELFVSIPMLYMKYIYKRQFYTIRIPALDEESKTLKLIEDIKNQVFKSKSIKSKRI